MHELGDQAKQRQGIETASVIALLLGMLLLAACGGGSTASGRAGGTTGASSTATPQVTATVTSSGTPWSGQPPTVAGLTWVQHSTSTGKPQVWASIGGKAGRMIAEATGDDCATSALGPPVLSPDAKHIAVVGGAGCGDGQSHGPILVVDVATGSMTQVADTNAITNERSVGWLDNTTLYFAGGSVNVYQLGATSVTALPGTTGAVSATVRGSQLFYVTFVYDHSSGVQIHALLHRYSPTSQRDVTVIDLGAFNLPTGQSPPDFHSEGWDVSADGTHVVYQVTAAGPVPPTSPIGISSSRIYYASADNSTRSQILQYLATNNLVRLRLSPDGRQVAVTEAIPAPDIISGCVNSPGISPQSDPCFHSYTSRQGFFSAGYAAWSPDSSAFIAAASNGDAAGAGLYRFVVGTPSGTLVQPGGYSPWEW